ncbi:MAG: winged helix DNA-binding domain-containing protein [Actinobacteria bacterium]|nr:MAG: winged helix DNA-binding domain-containing protein [Actinomycetota bacterium]
MGRGCLTRVGTRPHHSRAEPRAPRAPAPPTTAAPQRASCDRTRGCAAGAVAALPVHRSLVAARRVSARAADARGRGASRRQVDVDARDAPPRQLRRLPRIRRALHSGASRTHRARARESTRRRRSRRAHARARTTHLRKPSLAARAPLVHTPAGSVWRKRTGGSRYVPASTWLGADGRDGGAAATHLVNRYLSAFGPATCADAAQWTGLAVGILEQAFSELALRTFRDERGRQLFDVPRGPLPSATIEARVRFLPMWDSSLLAHADRSRILPEEHRKTVIRKNGDVLPSFLVDGFVAGTWGVEDGRVQLDSFEPLPRDVRRALNFEARALAEFCA